jgi:hypothetical protein
LTRPHWRAAALAGVFAAVCAAQMTQNPSPMVEHTRGHPRLKETKLPGRRETLSMGTLFLPTGVKAKNGMPVLFFFHGGEWIPEVAARHNGMAAVSVQLGSGSGTYARPFSAPARFTELLREAESKAGVRFGRVYAGGWSAGCGAVREIVSSPAAYDRVRGFICIDGIHSGYPNGKPGPLESEIEIAPLDPWLKLGRDAIAGRKRALITHSEIFPGTFVSTTETADYLVDRLGVNRRAVLKWGPMKTQQVSEAHAGHFVLMGFAGNSAPDHVDQLHSLPQYLRRVK